MTITKYIFHLFRQTVFFILLLMVCCSIIVAHNGFEWSEPVNLRILNSTKNDFAPTWNKYEKLLYFNSERSLYSMFYTTHHNDTSDFSKPILIINGINQHRNNQSYIAFFNENEAVLSTFRNSDRRPYLNLFTSQKKKKEWGKPSIIEILASDNFSAHPTISPDGDVLIFSTNRESEKKDTDLWASYLQEDHRWGLPVFISELNTSGNEITPFLISPA